MTMASASSRAIRAWRKISDGNQRRVVGDDAAGIDEARSVAGPLDFAVDAVAGDAGLVADDGAAEPVRRLKSVDLPTLGRPQMTKRAGIAEFARSS